MKRLYIPLAIIILLAGTYTVQAQQATRYVNLNTWPLDPDYTHVTAYPDSPWTHEFLGFVPGQRCPGYFNRGIDDSQRVWRNPSRNLNDDWIQASRGNRWVACYYGHRGTDIATPPDVPVYAAGDGTITEVSEYENGEWQVYVQHRRLLDDGLYFEWVARYLHLRPDIPVRVGMDVVEGQVLGYIFDLAENTHLHFQIIEVEGDLDIFRCAGDCVVDPWGPIWLWVDDDFNRQIDPAPSVLPAAQPNTDLVAGVGTTFAGEERWHLPVAIEAGTRLRVQMVVGGAGTLRLYPSNAPDEAITCEFEAAQGGEVATLNTDLPAAWRNGVVGYTGPVEGAPQAFAIPPDPESLEGATPRDTACTLKTPAAPSPLHAAIEEMGRAARRAAEN